MEMLVEIIISLFAAVVALGIIAKKLKIPYPIILVIGGLGLGFIPKLPHLQLDPDLIFFTILPPILFSGGYFTPVSIFKKNLGPIIGLAIGLVIITTLITGVFGYFFAELPWALAFLLGAIISPPDAIAATSITSRLKVHHQIVAVIEGESLINDASALVIYKMCLAGLITGTFSFAEASFDFFAICIGGIAIGLIIGWITLKIINMIKDAALCCTVSLIIPYLSYFFADHLEMSGVLSAVTAGIIHGWFLPATLNPIIKLEMGAVWKMFVFLLNGAAFILIGLQLPMIINDIQNYDAYNLTIYAICLNLVVLIVRFFWVYLSIYLPSRINKNLSQSHPHFDWKNCLIISWCGMRGIVSLASALALPILINNEPFEDRSLIILLTFSVIFVTLVLQGLTLPFLIKKLNAYKGDEEGLEEIQIRLKTSEAAMEKIKELSKVAHINKDMLNQVKIKYEDKILSASTTLNNSTSSDDNSKISQYRNTQIELLLIERHKVINLRNKGAISFKVAKRILTDIDFEAARLINRFGEEED